MSLWLKLCIVYLLTISLLIINPRGAAAHILKQDNGVYAVMHIDPDDNPLAGQPTTILLEFGANQGVFHLNDCECQVAVIENGRTVVTPAIQPAFFGTNYQAITKINFPKIDAYQLNVSGRSSSGQFSPFRISYDIRVVGAVGQSNKNAAQKNGLWVIGVSLLSLGLVGAIAYLQLAQSPRYRPSRQAKKS